MTNKCKCRHEGSMHSNQENTHIGECFHELPDGTFCSCMKFDALEKENEHE